MYKRHPLHGSGILRLLLAAGLPLSLHAQQASRDEMKVPDIPCYMTLKCDFHTHTMFSDGDVLPTVRVEEAWREGYDAIALTDHIEYQPNKSIIGLTDRNVICRSAMEKANDMGIILIQGAEITREAPPYHINAIFVADVNKLDTPDWRDALKAAADQGAFLFWNHPDWRQPNGIPRWYEEHTEIYQKGWVRGIEVVNGRRYYPLAFQWSLEKKITMVGNSDIHSPVGTAYDFSRGEHRPATLVFTKERTAESIKEALLDGRTAVYSENLLIGEEKYVRPIYENAIRLLDTKVAVKGDKRAYLRLRNASDIGFELVAAGSMEEFIWPWVISVPGDRTVLAAVAGNRNTRPGKSKVRMQYTVRNALIAPDRGLPVFMEIDVDYEPAPVNE